MGEGSVGDFVSSLVDGLVWAAFGTSVQATLREPRRPGPGRTAIELRILSVIPTRNLNPTLTLKETHTAEITIRSRIKSRKTAL